MREWLWFKPWTLVRWETALLEEGSSLINLAILHFFFFCPALIKDSFLQRFIVCKPRFFQPSPGENKILRNNSRPLCFIRRCWGRQVLLVHSSSFCAATYNILWLVLPQFDHRTDHSNSKLCLFCKIQPRCIFFHQVWFFLLPFYMITKFIRMIKLSLISYFASSLRSLWWTENLRTT